MEFKDLITRAVAVREKYAVLERKEYGREWTANEIAQGFAGDVGDLMKIVMAKESIRSMEDIDAKLEHELADCLWSVLVLAKKFNIELESSFLEAMDKLEKQISEKTMQ